MEKNYATKDKNRIKSVEPGSIAEELDIEVGDRLVKINNRKVEDIIDYLYLLADEYVEVEVEKQNGEVWVLEIEKEYYEELGVEFENPIMDKAKSCSNKCVFCFIDQMPPGMRETLYFKDDDSRLSFLQGNFVTLTNLKQRDLERIVEYRISPLNVSIHTTDPELRVKMLKNKFAGDVLGKLKYLVDNGIEVNGQIVLCPGYNDKAALESTLRDLHELSPALESVAIVPVGITKFRENLAPLTIFNPISAKETIEQVEILQREFLKASQTRFAFLSDEFYMIVDKNLPAYEDYEGFIQLENGVGLMRKFEYELLDAIKNIQDENKYSSVSIITGTSAYEYMKEMANHVMHKYDIKIEVHKILNDFFGHTITVAGLITAKDIINQLKETPLLERVLIPDVMLRSGEDVFLDDLTVSDLEKALNRPVSVTKVEGMDFLQCLLGGNSCRNQ
ncbi:MAG: DUF512 domain-containing protein [Clostridia bacterium]|nr:DUF512 domain-containing protein [Clostridia bacterium]